MARSYLKVYFDFEEKTGELNDGEKGRLLLALLRYAISGEKPVLSGNERYLFPTFKGEVDREIAVYETRIANGMRGGRPAREETENNQTKPNVTETEPKETETPKNKNKEQEDIKENTLTGEKEKRKRFSPPTLEEVSAYCRERRNKVDPQRFIDYYEARGWELKHGQKVKDWMACIRTWESQYKVTPIVKPGSFNDYKQRDYTEDELEARCEDI